MTDGNELLKAIARLGGIDPFSALEDIVSPHRPVRFLDTRSPLLRELLSSLWSARNEADDNKLKQILWDARAATLVAKTITADEKAHRLKALDEIGNALFQK